MAEIRSEQGRLEQELAELRIREATYRQRLQQEEALGARLRGHTQSMHHLFRSRPPTRRQLGEALKDVARISSQALGVRRTSVWLLNQGATELSCVLQLEEEPAGEAGLAHGSPPEAGAKQVLDMRAHPTYLRALQSDCAVAVADATTDPRTLELRDYLRDRGVGALLDIPIIVPGALLGVVCHEHVGGPRRWHEREVEFATGVAQLVALSLESERRLKAEFAANNTEARYEHLVESLPVTVYSFDVRSGALDYLSRRAEELGGESVDKWLKEGVATWVGLIHPDDREPVLQRFRQGTTGSFPEEVTYRVLLPGGTRWVRDTCNVVRDHAGRPAAIQGVLADVTKQTETELSLAESERRYRSLLEHEDLIGVNLDPLGRITFVNDAFVRMSGYAREGVLGRDWFELLLAPNQRASVRERFLSDMARGRVARRFEIAVTTHSGETRRLLSTNVVLRSPDGENRGSASVAIDVTERRRLEDALLQQTKVESLGRLAAGVAHDFNNLLTVISAQNELIERRCRTSPLHAELGGRFAAVNQALTQATDLTRSLLVYGRKHPGRIESFTLDSLILEALPVLEAMAGADLRIETSLHAEDVTLTHDRTRIRQVLVNLVGNAVDATRGYGSRVRIATHVEFVEEATACAKGLSHGGEFVVLSLSDDGRGMDPSTLARIFDPFFTTKADGRGTGLGLAITQSVVNQAGGFLMVESAPGGGTQFRAFLRGEQSQRISRVGLSVHAPASSGAPRVLLVSEPGPSRDLIAGVLEPEYVTVAVSGSREAAELLVFEAFDLLITAGHLPDGSGTVLAHSARSLRPELRVVLMADRADEDAGFDAVLEQPIEARMVLEAARAVLDRSAQNSG